MAGETKAGKKRLPLPKRFNVALTEEAYAALRELNARTGLGNNYCLTVLLTNLSAIADEAKLARAFDAFIAEYGAPGAAQPPAPRDKP